MVVDIILEGRVIDGSTVGRAETDRRSFWTLKTGFTGYISRISSRVSLLSILISSENSEQYVVSSIVLILLELLESVGSENRGRRRRGFTGCLRVRRKPGLDGADVLETTGLLGVEERREGRNERGDLKVRTMVRIFKSCMVIKC